MPAFKAESCTLILACGDVRKGFEWLVPPTVVPVKNVVELGCNLNDI